MDGGSITVHSPSTCRQLELVGNIEDVGKEATSPDHVHVTLPHSSSRSSRGSPSREAARLSRASSAAQMAHVQTWLTQKARRAVVALPDDPELKEVKEVCHSILQEEQAFITELEDMLSSRASQEQCKREMLYHKWTERVFSPLHQQLAQSMDSQQWRALDRAKSNLFQKYLEYRNRKAVFLDTVSAEEYDPLSLRQRSFNLTAKTQPLDDPLLSQEADRATEHLIIGTEKGLSPWQQVQARQPVTMDPVSWLAVQLVFIDSDARKRSRLRVRQDCSQQQQQQGSGKESSVNVPHKTPIKYPHIPLSLSWPSS